MNNTIDFENYTFKTDRLKQWQVFEKRDRLDGRSKKWIAWDKKFFFDGPEEGWEDTSNIGRSLFYLPDRSIEGIQDYFDKHVVKPLETSAVKQITVSILDGGGGMFQHVMDDAYYVYHLFGEKWTPETTLKLRIRTKEPIKPVSANKVYSCAFASLSYWLERTEPSEFDGYLRYMPEFMREVILHVDSRAFSLEKQQSWGQWVNGDFVSLGKLRALSKFIIKFAHKPETGDPLIDEKTAVAKQFFAMFKDVEHKLPNYSAFLDQTLEEFEKEKEND